MQPRASVLPMSYTDYVAYFFWFIQNQISPLDKITIVRLEVDNEMLHHSLGVKVECPSCEPEVRGIAIRALKSRREQSIAERLFWGF